MSQNILTSVKEKENQFECFSDQTILLNESGASLNGKNLSQLNVTQLKRWLACRKAESSFKVEERLNLQNSWSASYYNYYYRDNNTVKGKSHTLCK